MNDITISIIESIYLIYMFLFFKTSTDFNVLTSPNGWWFEHLIGDEYGNRVCPFGQVIIFVFVAILLIRHHITIPKYIMITIIIIGFLMSFMNLNALVYILPILIYESYKMII